uniref:APO protein 1ic n=1 Tax=Rhizophora mucronata TaxID=61149 RepID=A0A2P2KP25_RHIMU
MLQQLPSVSPTLWNPSQNGVCLGIVELKRPRTATFFKLKIIGNSSCTMFLKLNWINLLGW